jgi:hypothetical protein
VTSVFRRHLPDFVRAGWVLIDNRSAPAKVYNKAPPHQMSANNFLGAQDFQNRLAHRKL